MSDLIERLEAATVGSIALDGDIHRVLFPADLIMTDGGSAGTKGRPAVREPIGSLPNVPGDVISNCIGVPAYTTSIDAALALAERVLDGDHSYSLTHDWGGFNRAKVHAITDGPVTGEGDADTMPLALCIAILRAIPEGKS